ncbi:MAG: prepilin peptidase [Candidatus Aenigmarchaeota archaeon]|nr:prepilin peptidase [Candidatus Aenigmarchaeota archaeon]
MIEIFLLAAMAMAFAGSFAAGLWDLKTSDIPDEVICLMTILGIFIWYVYALTFGIFSIMITSLILGTAILAAGWLLYNRGMWGFGDATLFASIFYLLPDMALFFDYIFNLVLVMLVYLIAYSVIVGIRTKGTFQEFSSKINKQKYTVGIVTAIAVFFALFAYQFFGTYSLWIIAIPVMAIFAVYARALEKKAFVKRINYSQLKEGDVLLESKKWKGLGKAEAELLRKRKGFVTVKDGVRMGMVFPITLLLTILYGNIMILLLFGFAY